MPHLKSLGEQRAERCIAERGDTVTSVTVVGNGGTVEEVAREWSPATELPVAFAQVADEFDSRFGQGADACVAEQTVRGRQWQLPGFHVFLISVPSTKRLQIVYTLDRPQYSPACPGSSE